MKTEAKSTGSVDERTAPQAVFRLTPSKQDKLLKSKNNIPLPHP